MSLTDEQRMEIRAAGDHAPCRLRMTTPALADLGVREHWSPDEFRAGITAALEATS